VKIGYTHIYIYHIKVKCLKIHGYLPIDKLVRPRRVWDRDDAVAATARHVVRRVQVASGLQWLVPAV
jgi:hypothetical protein